MITIGTAAQNGLICTECGHGEFHTTETRLAPGSIRRRRICKACGHRVTTHERIDEES
jgi:transcriptional regulator NrdR family protein